MLGAVPYQLHSKSLISRNLAFEDTEWKAINQIVDTFYVVESLPASICHALMPSLAPSESSAVERPWRYARAEHLLELREFVEKNPLAATERIIAWAGIVLQKEAEALRRLEERERKKRRRTKEGGGEQQYPSTVELPDQSTNVLKQVVETLNPEEFVTVIPRRTVEGFSTGDLLSASPVAQSKIVRTTSSKLNCVLNEVWRPPWSQFDPYALL
jgi:hypothetical protein